MVREYTVNVQIIRMRAFCHFVRRDSFNYAKEGVIVRIYFALSMQYYRGLVDTLQVNFSIIHPIRNELII